MSSGCRENFDARGRHSIPPALSVVNLMCVADSAMLLLCGVRRGGGGTGTPGAGKICML